jgi:hypothetical protein
MCQKMFVEFTRYFGCIRLHKKYYAYTISVISFFIVFQFYIGPFLINKKLHVQLIKAIETDSHSSTSMIYQYQPRIFNENSNYPYSAVCGRRNYPAGNSVHKNELVNLVTIVLQSRSLMYCPVPKVATKTILIVMLYMHVHDISKHLDNNWTNIDAARARTEQMINIPAFIEDLRKVW